MDKIFTFWEGPMPDYIHLCMESWKFPYVVLNYNNLHEYMNFEVTPLLKKFILPRVANCVRAHVLRDQGGYWLDTDTIMITDKLPTTTLIGYPETRGNTIGYLYAEYPHMDMFERWSEFQDEKLKDPNLKETRWSFLSNDFTDPYAKEHNEITIAPVRNCWPETYMVDGNAPRFDKYKQLYFEEHYHLSDFEPTDMLMLHNSWTPDWYKELSSEEILNDENHTLSNILREVLATS